jgi:peroxiredoxin
MSVVGDGAGRAFVADWNSPFVVSLDDTPAPEVRASMRHALPGAIVRLSNDGDEVLWLGPPSAGHVDRVQVPPGGEARWLLPDDHDTDARIATDDPDEPEVVLVQAGRDGPVVGDPAPAFIERDLSGEVWDSSALTGQVVFLGMFQEGCPVCSSEVPVMEATLREALAGEDGSWPEGFVRLWAYDGQESRARGWAEEYGIADPVLTDGDRSLRQDYFVPNGDGAFAANPRHYLIDRQGRLVFLSTTVAPGDLLTAIEDALATD